MFALIKKKETECFAIPVLMIQQLFSAVLNKKYSEVSP